MQGDKTDRQPRHAKPPFVGVGGRVEDRVDEARDPWLLIEEEHEKLRKKEWAGFEYLWIALHEESFCRARLRAFGLDGEDATNPREIPGARQARTVEERREAHQAHRDLLEWQTVAKAGAMILIGGWIFDQVVEGFRRSPGAGIRPLPIVDIGDWLPGPAELNAKLFDVMRRAWTEAKAEVLGSIMEQYPKDRGAEQAIYLLAGLIRTRMDPEIGKRRIAALSTLAGVDSARARERQLLRELPGATRIAWDAVGPAGGILGLRNSVARIVEEAGKDMVNREAGRKVHPTESVDETLELQGGKRKDPEQGLSDSAALSLTPERAAEELPGIQLFQTQEAVRQELGERIKQYGLTKKEAEVATLRYEGNETQEIARIMGVEEVTVRVHDRNIRKKARAAGA